MRKTVTYAALAIAAAALAGCNKPAETPAATDTASTAASASAAPQAAATLTPGTFDVVDAAGKTLASTTINADGTYTDDSSAGVRTAGIVKMKDGKTCFDPSGSAAEECYTDSAVGPDGTFTTTDNDGTVLTVRKRAQ